MKPTSYSEVPVKECCYVCSHSCYMQDTQREVCIKHRFTIDGPATKFKCDDFSTEEVAAKPKRRNLLDVVHGISPRLEDHPTKPITLILEDAYIESSNVALKCATGARDLDVRITGYCGDCGGYTCDIKVKAINILVEET